LAWYSSGCPTNPSGTSRSGVRAFFCFKLLVREEALGRSNRIDFVAVQQCMKR
jgi:hypothetical protein